MRLLSLVISIIIFHQVYSQNRLEIDSLFAGAYATKGLDSLQWKSDEATFTYLKGTSLYFQTYKSTKEKELATLSDLEKITGKAFATFPSYRWKDGNRMAIITNRFYADIDMKSKAVLFNADFDKNAKNISVSPCNNIAYTLDSSLVVIDSTGYKTTVFVKETNINYGESPYRNEFGTTKGFFWSQDGQQLLFYKYDDSDLTIEYFKDSTDSIISTARYPYAGRSIGKTTVGIYNVPTQSTTFIDTKKDEGKYYTNPAWNSDGRSIYINILNREQNTILLKEYDAESGEYVRMVMKESATPYIEQSIAPLFLKTKPEFLWVSLKTGHAHIYHYDIEGLLLSPLTTGDWDVTDIIGVDKKEENLYFIGTKEGDVTGRYLYKVNIISLQVKCLSQIAGTHKGHIDFAEGYILDEVSSYDIPHKTMLKDPKGNVLREVQEAKYPFKFVDMPIFEQGTFRADDNKTDLHYHIFKPTDFDPNNLYPVILYVYGGPHIQLVRNKWLGGIGILPYLLAQEDFIVFCVDNRGSYGRGNEFEQITHNKLGQIELEDQLSAIKYLSDFSYIDETKIGVYGWSYGGFMALNLATKAPSKVRAVVAGAPVTSWTNYEIMYTERYMGTPENNPDGYAWADMEAQTDSLKAEVLILHGNLDNTTMPSQHVAYTNAAKKRNKHVTLKTYYGHKHHISGDEKKEFLEDVISFFTDHLQ